MTGGVTIIPALPGFDVLEVISNADASAPAEYVTDPVIGWRIKADTEGSTQWVAPIVFALGDVADRGDWAVRRPDGSVFDCSETYHDNAADWLASRKTGGAA